MQTAVITGAASGIGRALVHHAADKGMRVLAADIDADGLAETAAQAVAAGAAADAVVTHTVDVSSEQSVAELADAAFAALGQVDLLFNNAGVFQGGLMWTRSVEDWKWTLDVNLWGIIHAVRSFVPRMIEQDTVGHIVNTASVAAWVAGQYSSPYVVSKCAAFSITECLALDLKTSGSKIGVSVLCPGATDTGIARTDRVRPDAMGQSEGEDASFVADSLASITESSMNPTEAAAITFAGIEAGDFLIATKPSYRSQLEARFAALAERKLPDVPPVD